MCSKQDIKGDDMSCQSKRRKENYSENKNIGLDARNYRLFDKNFPFFRQPNEIGSFSLDINRKFEDSRNQLKYFIKPQDFNRVQFDLRKGYSTMVRKDETEKEYIDSILKWINKNKKKFIVEGNPAGNAG